MRITLPGGIRFAVRSADMARVAGSPGPLRVLLADADPERVAVLERQLREMGDAVILRVPGSGRLAQAVRDLAADVIIVDMARPDRDGLDDLRRLGSDNPRPIVM